MKRRIIIILLIALNGFAQHRTMPAPELPGIKITRGETIQIPVPGKVKTSLAYRFRDGRIVTGHGEKSMWSYDGGKTWKKGPESMLEEATLDLGKGEIITVSRNSRRRPDGKYAMRVLRSTDNWKTFQKEEAVVDIPNASYTVTGGGGRVDGFLFHHGLVQLQDGTLVGSMYGNYEGDTELCLGYPTELNQRKYRTIVVFSKDKGKTWGDHVLVAYDRMLGRGIPTDHEMVGKSIPASRAGVPMAVPAITSEGFRESDLSVAPNGDLICIMRSGGRNPKMGVKLFPTPLYCSRSGDGGRTWTLPEQIADRGISPSIVTLENGIMVCVYSRPGYWLIFSDDNGKTWRGAFQFSQGNATGYIEETAPNTIQVYYEAEEEGTDVLLGTFFTVKKTQ